MMDCLIVGDSIGIGIADAHQGCIVLAESGINTNNYMKGYSHRIMLTEVDYNKVVISLGSNDPASMNTVENLTALRELVKGKKVYWVLPIKHSANAAVFEVARRYGDATVVIPESADKVHPTPKGYYDIANKVF